VTKTLREVQEEFDGVRIPEVLQEKFHRRRRNAGSSLVAYLMENCTEQEYKIKKARFIESCALISMIDFVTGIHNSFHTLYLNKSTGQLEIGSSATGVLGFSLLEDFNQRYRGYRITGREPGPFYLSDAMVNVIGPKTAALSDKLDTGYLQFLIHCANILIALQNEEQIVVGLTTSLQTKLRLPYKDTKERGGKGSSFAVHRRLWCETEMITVKVDEKLNTLLLEEIKYMDLMLTELEINNLLNLALKIDVLTEKSRSAVSLVPAMG